MSVRLRESLDWRSRHQKRLEHAILNQGNPAGLHAFVIVKIGSVQVHPRHTFLRGIEHHRKKIGEHLRVYALRKSLTIRFVALTMAFNAMPENLMKEDTGSATRQNGWTDKWIHQRSVQQIFQILSHTVYGSQNFSIFR